MKTKQKFTYILKEGYLKGSSEYIIATQNPLPQKNLLKELKNVQWAIYNGISNKRLTPDFDWISPTGLVKGQSKYFRATKKGKEAIFTLENQVTPWFDKIRDRGVLTGESSYYWGKLNGYYALYDINNNKKLTDNFKSSVIAGAVIGKSNYIIGSYGEEIFFIVNLKTGKKVSPDFDEDILIKILKDGNLEKALIELNSYKKD